jgi:AraC-like DNA-binding protein
VLFFLEKSPAVWMVVDVAVFAMVFYFFNAQVLNITASPSIRFLSFSCISFMSPFLLTFLICLLWKVFNERLLPWYYYLWFVPPISMASICLMLYFMVDKGEAAFFQELYDRFRCFPEQFVDREIFRIFNVLHNYCFRVIFYIYALWIIFFSLISMRNSGFTWKSFTGFLFKRSSLPPVHILMLLLCLIIVLEIVRFTTGYNFLLDNPSANIVFSVLTTICLVLVLFATFGIGYEECTLRQMLLIDPKENFKPDDDGDDDVTALLSPDDNAAFRQVQARLDEGLRDLMVEKHAFLDSELRLVDVARTLCTNRNYLSRHINERYGINFNEYLNRMRIRYSKQYMLDNPNQLLDQIAIECGFGTAQSFGRKFKAIEGVTPRTWMVNNRKK